MQTLHESNEGCALQSLSGGGGVVYLGGVCVCVCLDRLFSDPRTCAPSLTCTQKHCSAEIGRSTETGCAAAAASRVPSANIQAHAGL